MRKLIVIALFLGISCSPKNDVIRIQGSALGTTYGIVCYDCNIQPSALQFAVDSIVESANNSMSTYRPNSLISRINRGEENVVVDDQFKKVPFAPNGTVQLMQYSDLSDEKQSASKNPRFYSLSIRVQK